MIKNYESVRFTSGTIQIVSMIKKFSTCFLYVGANETGKFMIKSVPLKNSQLHELFQQEINNQKNFSKDSNVLHLLDSTVVTQESEIGLLKFEYPENNTLKFFMKTHELNEEQISYIFKEILVAVIKINDFGVVHRNIVPQNIWIDKNYCFKLSGFERSVKIDETTKINLKINSQKLCHPVLRPPDLNENCEIAKMDVWGLGCLLFYLMYRNYPFGEQVKNSEVPQYLFEILNKSLETDPDERPLPRVLLNMLLNHKVPTLPFFFKGGEIKAVSLKFSEKYSALTVLNAEPGPPDLFFIQQVLFTVWAHPESTIKLLNIVKNSNTSSTVVAIKNLILIHRLLLSGPPDILPTLLFENIQSLLNQWTSDQFTHKDQYFCEFLKGLINHFSKILKEKINFHLKSETPSNWKFEPNHIIYPECINFAEKFIKFLEGLTIGYSILPEILKFLGNQILEECQRIIICVSKLGSGPEIYGFEERLKKINLNEKKNSVRVTELKNLFFTQGKNVRDRNLIEVEPSAPYLQSNDSILNLAMEPSAPYLQSNDSIFNIKTGSRVQRSVMNYNNSPQSNNNFCDLLDLDFSPSAPSLLPSNISPNIFPIKSPSILPNISPSISPNISPNNPFSTQNYLNFVNPSQNFPESILITSTPKNSVLKSFHKRSNSFSTKNIATPVASEFSIERRWLILPNQLKIGQVLGEGVTSTVYKGEFKRTPVAIKKFHKAGHSLEFQREVTAMLSLRHPNLALFMGACTDPEAFIVSEYCEGGSLFCLLHHQRSTVLHWDLRFKMIVDIARGMLYLHESSPAIIHRDLKTSNLLLLNEVNSQPVSVTVKITDFGIARIIEKINMRLTMRMGTCHWMAPEVINGENYGVSADVYSFGIVVWEIVTREIPYADINQIEVPLRVLNGERPDLNKAAPGTPDPIKQIIKLCLHQNPQQRPSFRQIMQELEKIGVGLEI